MNRIVEQVNRARRRLTFEQALRIFPWCLFAGCLVAAIGLAIPRIWYIAADQSTWQISWLAGAIGSSIVVGLILTYVKRRQTLDAAVELDRRYGLKERVASALQLTESERATEAGHALVSDAERRVERIDVSEHFTFQPTWRTLMPLLPAVLIFVLTANYFPLIEPPSADASTSTSQKDKKQIKESAKDLKRKIMQRKEDLEKRGLKEAASLLKEVEGGLNDLNKKDKVNKKDSMIELNNLAKKLKQRRDKLGGAEQMQKQLNRLKDVQQGPADKIADAMKKGDLDKAMDAVKDLKEKLKNGDLNKEQQKKLADQLKQMKDKLQDLKDKHEQAKRDLQKQIDQKLAEGDRDAAGKLQQQLDQMQQQDNAMDKLQDLASKLGQCADCMKQGDQQGAGQQLDQLGDALQQMQDELDELQSLEQALSEISDAKDAMNCQSCGGKGCSQCQGGSQSSSGGDGDGDKDGEPGMGNGKGQGKGDRAEAEDDTDFYESEVPLSVKDGTAVRTGDADGPNIAGVSRASLKAEIESAKSKDTDPLTDQKLSKPQKEHAKEYFEKFRSQN